MKFRTKIHYIFKLKRFNLKFILVLISVLLLYSCRKLEDFPVEPYIEFVSITKIDNGTAVDDKAILKFFFTDGDGDIGLSQSDTLPPFDTSSVYYYNFFIDYFEKQNGVFKKIDLPLTQTARIPVLNTSTANKALKGHIEVEVFINNILSQYDTIKFQFKICDRALNMSNIAQTDEIIVKKQ